MRVSAGTGWFILLQLFLVEVIAVAVAGLWGWQQSPRWVWVWFVPLVVVVAWGLLAAPRARFGSPVAATIVKVAVFGLATAALFDVGRAAAAWAFLCYVIVVHLLALLPGVADLTANP